MTFYFDCRCLELCPAVVAGKTCNERWSDGRLNGRPGALYAQFQLHYWDGVSRGCLWPINYHGEQRFTQLGTILTIKSLYRREGGNGFPILL